MTFIEYTENHGWDNDRLIQVFKNKEYTIYKVQDPGPMETKFVCKWNETDIGFLVENYKKNHWHM